MGRYSFFILSFCYRGHYVYADSDSSDILLDSSSYVDDTSGSSTVDSESSTLDSSNSIQQEESTSTSVSEESSEEDVQNSLDENYEFYDLSNPFVFGNTNNGEEFAVDQNIMSRMFTTFASGGPSTVYAGPNNGWNITGYFTSWRLDGTLNATMIANNIDMIVNQARNSFSYVNSRLNGLENWKSSASSTLSSLNSSVSSQRTQISNAFSRISAAENDISSIWSSINTLDTRSISNRNRISTAETNITSIKTDLSSVWSSIGTLDSRSTSNRNRIESVEGSVSNILADIKSVWSSIGTLDTRSAKNRDDIVSIWSSIGTLDSRSSSNRDRITSAESVISSINKDLTSVWSSIGTLDTRSSKNRDDIVSIWSSISTLDTRSVSNRTRISDLETQFNNVSKDLGNVWSSIGVLDSRSQKNRELIDSLDTWKNVQLAWNTVQELQINNLRKDVTTDLEKTWSSIDTLDKRSQANKDSVLSIWESIGILDTRSVSNRNRITDLESFTTNVDEDLNNIWLSVDVLDKRTQNISKSIGTLTDTTNAIWDSVGTLDSRSISNRDRISNIESTLNGFSWSDAGIIAAIIGLHDTWKSKDYNASILPDDGDAVKLMKSVANKIGSSISTNISLLRDIFGKDGTYWVEYDKRWNNFPLWLQGLLNNYFDNIYNMENKDSLLYRLVYFFIDEMTKTRDFVIEINDNLLIANDSILIIVDWLRMIYSKPPDIVNVSIPPFDFDRLQQILNGLNFGNIVNEAGTNIWDFLSQLIKTLGEIISTAITGLTDVVGEILDLLGDLINQIIKLIVPENLDFLDTGFGTVKSKIDIKFGSFLSLGNQVKEVVQPIDQDFKKVVSIDIMGAKFNPDFSTIDWVVVRFRTVMALSIWMSVAIYIYRKITGNGDLINDN